MKKILLACCCAVMVLFCSCKSDSPSFKSKTWTYATTDAAQVKTMKISYTSDSDTDFITDSGCTTLTYGNGTVKDFKWKGEAISGGRFTITVAGIGSVLLDSSVTILTHFEDSAGTKTYVFSGPCTSADDVKSKILTGIDKLPTNETLYFSTNGGAVYGPLTEQK